MIHRCIRVKTTWMLRVTHRAGVQEPLWFLHIRNVCRAAKCDVVANKITAPNMDNWLPRLILQAFPHPVCRSHYSEITRCGKRL